MLELNYLGDGAVFDHLGIVTQSIKKITHDVNIIKDDIQKVYVAFIKMHGITIELIEPVSKESPISSNLKKGRKLVHICFRVPDINVSINTGRKHGFHSITRPVPAKAFQNKKIAWLFSRTYGLIELLEK